MIKRTLQLIGTITGLLAMSSVDPTPLSAVLVAGFISLMCWSTVLLICQTERDNKNRSYRISGNRFRTTIK